MADDGALSRGDKGLEAPHCRRRDPRRHGTPALRLNRDICVGLCPMSQVRRSHMLAICAWISDPYHRVPLSAESCPHGA